VIGRSPGIGFFLVLLFGLAVIVGGLGFVSASIVLWGVFFIALPVGVIVWGLRAVNTGRLGVGILALFLGVTFIGLAFAGGALVFVGLGG